MKMVKKYQLAGGVNEIEMPAHARPLSVALHGNVLFVYVLVDASNYQMQPRTFYVVDTGHGIPDDCEYVGTATSGTYACHVFEEKASQRTV